MKGQYRIIVEVMLVLIGIFITGFVVSTFGIVQGSVTNVSTEDTYGAIANNVAIAVLKASFTNNTVVRVPIPDEVADNAYKIRLDKDKNEISVINVEDQSVSVHRKIFNISLPNRISTSEALSSGGLIEIVNDVSGIRIRRFSRV